MQRARRLVVLAVALAALFGCARGRAPEAPPSVADPATERTTSGGALVGAKGRYGGHAWYGLPFAKPPIGPLRWRAPEPPDAWSGTRSALEFGSACVQFASSIGGARGAKPGEPTGNEDCLYLNVYAPEFAAGAVPQGEGRLPVLFWIHGGGNSIGDTSFYDGSRLATEQKVIVVTTQYRLGPFGWLRHPALAGMNEDDRSGNYGTLDLVRSLRWVQENVAAFGGDPGNVTVFGESAGGTNVAMLLLSPRARGLFHRAILQSGGAKTAELAEAENYVDDEPPGHERSSGEAVLRLLQSERLAADRAAAKQKASAMTLPELAAWLRARPARQVLEAYADESFGGMIQLPRLFRDGAVLPAEEPIDVFARRSGWNAVPTMLGTNRDEVKLFLAMNPEHVRRWAVLPYLRDPARYERTARYQSTAWKASGADELATAMTAAGSSAWVYRFDWDEEPKLLWSDLAKIIGAAHGMEIPFVFGHFDLGRAGNVLYTEQNLAGREALAKEMMSYWAEFAYTGDPGRGRDGALPEWQGFREEARGTGHFLLLDTAAGGGLRMSDETIRTQDLVDEILADASFASEEERCRILAGISERSPTWREASYAAIPACRPYPVAAR
jgi:para-nitrobenzyl esterase